MHKVIALVASLALVAGAAVEATAAAPAEAGRAAIHVTPEEVAVTTFFNGTDLEIEGAAPGELKLAVLLTGADTEVALKKKGKVWGFLWMNVGEISFDAVPTTYLLATPGKVCDLAPAEVRRRSGIGLDVLAANRGVAGDGEAAQLYDELIKLKQHENLFGSFENAVEVAGTGDGPVTFSTVLPVPANLPEGTYRVALWGFGEDGGRQLAETGVLVHAVGVTHDIAAFAQTHGTLYGICALIIALVVGILTGMVFGMGGKGGH